MTIMEQTVDRSETEALLAALNLLGYHPKWQEYGLLTPAALLVQAEAMRSERHKTKEHYRYATFLAVLAREKSIANTTMERYVQLALLDPDKATGEAAISQLI